MGFQSTVRIDQTDAIVGEIVFGGPLRAEPKRTLSTDAANNVFGRAFQQVAGVANDGNVSADAGEAGIFAGIMVSPKEHALLGTSAGTLEASLTIPNNTEATFLKEGTIAVIFDRAANIGDIVAFNFDTGVLRPLAPGTSAPADHALISNCTVVRNSIPAAGLAYIHVNAE